MTAISCKKEYFKNQVLACANDVLIAKRLT